MPIDGVDKAALDRQVDGAQATGWTPLASSIRRAIADFPDAERGVVNAVVLVTDGLETCGGDPCAAAAEARGLRRGVTTHVVSFAQSTEERAILECIADAGDGLLLGADDADELAAALFQILEELDDRGVDGHPRDRGLRRRLAGRHRDLRRSRQRQRPAGRRGHGPLHRDEPRRGARGRLRPRLAQPLGHDDPPPRRGRARARDLGARLAPRAPQGAGETYAIADAAGLVVWEAPVEAFDRVWLLPGLYRIELAERVGDPVLQFSRGPDPAWPHDDHRGHDVELDRVPRKTRTRRRCARRRPLVIRSPTS